MNTKTYKMLTLLDEQIQNCTSCNLYQNGRAKPYWTDRSKWMMILESPGEREIYFNEPLIGKTGKMFWEMLEEINVYKEDFLIINSVNCRSMKNGRNLAPSEYHRDCCRQWIRKYVKVFEPNKIILMGNPAIHTILGLWGISKFNGQIFEQELWEKKIPCITCFHPSSMIYDRQKKDSIIECINMLKE